MKLSIVVPIYNVADYLPKCIDSLLNQNLAHTDYEIILVDDGSADRSGQIADEYACANENIRVIHQQNSGLSMARNAGVAVAQGDYVQFVDSDDYLEPNVLRTVVDALYRSATDVLVVQYRYVDADYEPVAPYKDSGRVVPACSCVCHGETYLQTYQDYRCYAVQYIIRRKLAQQCAFTAGIYFEDTEWVPRLLASAERVTSVDTVVYNYLMRQGSITQSVSEEKKRKVIDDKINLIVALQRQMVDKPDKRWHKGMIAHPVLSVLGCIVADFYAERAVYLHLLRQNHVYPLSYFHATRRVRRKLFLINLSPDLFCRCVAAKTRLRRH